MLFSRKRRHERDAAERLYCAVVEASRRPALYADLGVPDTLEGRFESLIVHLYAVIDRLRTGADADGEFARLLAEAFVSDMDATLREMGVGDLSVPRKVKEMFGAFAGRITAYSAARGDAAALAAALERNVYGGAAAPGAAMSLALYLEAARAGLREVGVDELKAGCVAYPAPATAARG
jgi:cytochrome b pre-mRNA-processing protein 3